MTQTDILQLGALSPTPSPILQLRLISFRPMIQIKGAEPAMISLVVLQMGVGAKLSRDYQGCDENSRCHVVYSVRMIAAADAPTDVASPRRRG